jgi:hypothetical protein
MESNAYHFPAIPGMTKRTGQTLALAGMIEYVVFLKSEPEKETTKVKGAGYAC